MTYIKTSDLQGKPSNDGVVRVIDGAFIPADPNNIDWQAYQAWLKAGNTPQEPTGADRTSIATKT